MEGGQVRPMLERISRRFPVKGSDAVHPLAFPRCHRCWILLDFAPASSSNDIETAPRVGFLLDFSRKTWSDGRALHV
jgi:hypothetical protein